MTLMSELEQCAHEPRLPLFGISVDASKCFDRIRWSDAWSTLQELHAPHAILRAMSTFYLAHQRFTHVRGLLDPTPWDASCGLLQGCPLSVMTTLILVASWHVRFSPAILAKSYIDDRLLVSSSLRALRDAWSESLDWDRERGWEANLDKTVVFSTQGNSLDLIPPLPQSASLTYLGHNLRTQNGPPSQVLQLRWEKARNTALKLAHLPRTLTVRVRAVLVSAVPDPPVDVWATAHPPHEAYDSGAGTSLS